MFPLKSKPPFTSDLPLPQGRFDPPKNEGPKVMEESTHVMKHRCRRCRNESRHRQGEINNLSKP